MEEKNGSNWNEKEYLQELKRQKMETDKLKAGWSKKYETGLKKIEKAENGKPKKKSVS